jgi:prefoldin alpha subunit
MEWTQTEKAKKPAEKAPAKQQQQQQQPQQKQVNIKDLSVQQLQNVGKQNKQEFNMLRQSLNGLKAAGTNFYGARAAVEGWKTNLEKGETEIMVPMTNTLLIRGKMVDAPMMVELGGGILMEKNTEDTIKFLDRRMQMVTTSLNKCGSEMQQKAMAGQAIEKEITDKMKNMEIYNKIYQ